MQTKIKTEIANKIALKLRSKYEDYIDVDSFLLPEIVEDALRDLLHGEPEFESVHFYTDKFVLIDIFDFDFDFEYEELHRQIVENCI